ncbi:hypothetical protein [Sapientia aquatica]|uniref:Uncharacterized protein n=1 Tax=Sapientia aquatica TaxID=1549640 RepID=A0A4R5VRZ6_9BURK|nr:hypothetical protein [Sapientia aquatica]TDK61337.1 hypothetical protein E2I14_17300 [Sapientia aquatica]
MERNANMFLKYLYVISLLVMIYPASCLNSSDPLFLVMGGGLTGILLVPFAIFRTIQIIKYPKFFELDTNKKGILTYRIFGIFFLVLGVLASLIQSLSAQNINQNEKSGDTFFWIFLLLYFLSMLGWLGIVLVEISLSARNKFIHSDEAKETAYLEKIPQKNELTVLERKKILKAIFSLGNFLLIAMIGGYFYFFIAIYPFTKWTEQVELNDGSVTIVEQRIRNWGTASVETWLTIYLPTITKQPIYWHEDLLPLIANLHKENLYVIGSPLSALAEKKYDCPRPAYVAFLWKKGSWSRIPFEQIPAEIYLYNLYLGGIKPNGKELMTVNFKNSIPMNERPIGQEVQLDHNKGGGC